jgi:DNA-binding MarR family transcriptional regulator
MTAAGFLIRRPDDRDNRLVRLWLTDSGRALRKPIEAERRSIERKITADLTVTERKHLLSALAKIHRSASDLLGGPMDHDNPGTP